MTTEQLIENARRWVILEKQAAGSTPSVRLVTDLVKALEKCR